jgi:hypothetical protein
MNEHKLLRMIEEAGFDFTPDIINKLQKFQNLIWVEREACAKTCEEYARKYAKDDVASKAQAWMMLQCAAAIRARGQ